MTVRPTRKTKTKRRGERIGPTALPDMKVPAGQEQLITVLELLNDLGGYEEMECGPYCSSVGTWIYNHGDECDYAAAMLALIPVARRVLARIEAESKKS